MALGAFRAVRDGLGSEEDQREAIDPIVIALPVSGARPLELDRLPPLVRNSNWPAADDTKSIAALATERAGRATRRLGERLRELGALDSVVQEMRARVEVPYPRNMAGIRSYPLELRPSLGKGLVDRANELWDIHTSLTTERVDTAAAALTGSLEGGGGFGKTRLAIEYVHRYGPVSYPGGLVWVDAEVPAERLEQQLVEIIEVLTGEEIDLVAFRETGRNAREELAEALHAQPVEQPLLYVVDNVPEPGRKDPPKDLSTWCPALGKVALLVTSRASQALAGNVEPLAVDVLPLGPAVSLLTQDFADRGAIDDQGWEQIAEWVGRLPLALVLLSAALRAGALAPGELVAMAVGARPAAELDRQMAAVKGSVRPGDLRGIAEAFKASYQGLPQKASRAARLLAQLSPEPIPIALLDALGDDVSDPATRAALVSRSFISPVPGGDVPMLGRMHRVLADYLRSFAPDDGSDARDVSKALVDLFRAEDAQDPRTWTRLGALLPHAQWVFQDLSRDPEAPSVDVETCVDLGLSIGFLLWVRGLAGSARSIEETAVKLAVDLLGEEHPTTLLAMNNLASTLLAQGDLPGARELEERALEARRRILGEEHPDTLTSMNNLAGTLRAQGDLPGAKELEERALEARRRILGEEHPATLLAMNNLAATLREQGDLPGAKELQERVLETNRRLLGEEHPATLQSMNNLAGTLWSQGDLPGARELQERVFEARRRILGEEHPATLLAMNNLASTLLAQGDLPGARELEERALEARRRILSEEHPDTLTSMSNLADTLRAQGDLAGAKELEEALLEAHRRIRGPH